MRDLLPRQETESLLLPRGVAAVNSLIVSECPLLALWLSGGKGDTLRHLKRSP
ncbi:hypothetical protein ALC57_16633 [Trachymyrmex cornetzi]|uniref:Uncharacterized protein n=1 Tax=Trachymyrmex cornetzi TaxID=471704 RepID=A0A151IUK5_9HYME|nr:hypothetical protein ALC57_16633 [Trachymyrmex cornetzi]